MNDEVDRIVRENRLIAENNELRATLERERKVREVFHRGWQKLESVEAKRERANANFKIELKKAYDERHYSKHVIKRSVKLLRAAGVSCDTDMDTDPLVSGVKRLIKMLNDERKLSWWKKLFG